MNTVVIIASFIFLIAYDGVARIKNGYDRQIQATKSALHSIKLRLADASELSVEAQRALETEMRRLISYVSCYELTEELIVRLKTISPSIFWDVENITDKKGRATDVYIKLVPDDLTRINLKAASFVKQLVGDVDASCSEHGPFSVSVDICIRQNSLFLLCHELGHIKYIIPNLAAYKLFYRKAYGQAKYVNLSFIGHGHRDKSGLIARQFEKMYRADMARYKQNREGELQGFVSMYSRLKKTHGNPKGNNHSAIANVF